MTFILRMSVILRVRHHECRVKQPFDAALAISVVAFDDTYPPIQGEARSGKDRAAQTASRMLMRADARGHGLRYVNGLAPSVPCPPSFAEQPQ
jgi:hypothetical protein